MATLIKLLRYLLLALCTTIAKFRRTASNQSINPSIKIRGLMCNQKLAETSLIYRTEPKQDWRCRKNGEQPESIMSVREREREDLWWEGFVKEVGFELGVKE